MSFRVGVTGHRQIADAAQLADAIDRALDDLAARADGRPIVLVSALAEGADRLAAGRALARPGIGLEAALPLPVDDYLTDFADHLSREAFRSLLDRARAVRVADPAPTREAAYAAAGRMVVEGSQALVALWDGRPARGVGGTAEVVALARRRELPLAWIRTANGPDRPAPAGPALVWERLARVAAR